MRHLTAGYSPVRKTQRMNSRFLAAQYINMYMGTKEPFEGVWVANNQNQNSTYWISSKTKEILKVSLTAPHVDSRPQE